MRNATSTQALLQQDTQPLGVAVPGRGVLEHACLQHYWKLSPAAWIMTETLKQSEINWENGQQTQGIVCEWQHVFLHQGVQHGLCLAFLS